MITCDYKITSCLFPFEFAVQHFKAVSQEVEWKGRCVHVILGILEILPTGINYIIAIFDAIFQRTINYVGPEQLEQIYGITTRPLQLGPEFYEWLDRPDAYDVMAHQTDPTHKIRLNHETHYLPVFRPQNITFVDTHVTTALTLETVERLAENPKNEHEASRFQQQTMALTQNKEKSAESDCYIVMRKEML